MNKKNITPNPQQPINRVTTGKLPNLLAELQEASLSGTHTLPQYSKLEEATCIFCSYEGEEE